MRRCALCGRTEPFVTLCTRSDREGYVTNIWDNDAPVCIDKFACDSERVRYGDKAEPMSPRLRKLFKNFV